MNILGGNMIPLYYFKNFSSLDSCLHAITLKSSKEPYSFSLALHTGEHKRYIVENRQKIMKQLSLNENISFIVAKQTHGDNIAIISEHKHRGWHELDSAIEDCDALITNQKGIMLTILTADCVPILLMDIEKNVIAAVHAGWRGSRAKIVAKTVNKMCKAFDCDVKNIVVGIGPSIGVCCYEVDSNVANFFKKSQKRALKNSEKYMLDLPMVNKEQLLSVGILESNIEMSHICTACEVDRYFSYRKEKGCSGRFMSMITLK
jgi:YfiH family protein